MEGPVCPRLQVAITPIALPRRYQQTIPIAGRQKKERTFTGPLSLLSEADGARERHGRDSACVFGSTDSRWISSESI